MISEYRGVLKEDGTLTEPRTKRMGEIILDKISDSGNARLLKLTTEPYYEDLKFAFPNHYPEIVVFLSLITRFGISQLIEKSDLTSTYSPEDVLDIYCTAKSFESETEVRQVIPKDVKEMDARLGLFWYSTKEDLDKINGIKKKRGAKLTGKNHEFIPHVVELEFSQNYIVLRIDNSIFHHC